LTDMPIATVYKGVGVHAGQSARRVARVKREIDKVGEIADLVRLAEIAGDTAWSPEARLLAGAKCIAGFRRATEHRESKPDIDPERVEACTAGLASLSWADPSRSCSLLDADCGRAAPREVPLDNEA
jgi:hypothetical protein